MVALVGTERQGHLAPIINVGENTPHRNTPKQSIGIKYLVDFLVVAQTERRSTEFYRKSPYSYKKATLNLIRFCMDHKLIVRREQYKSSFSSAKVPKVYYHITDNGRELLRLIG